MHQENDNQEWHPAVLDRFEGELAVVQLIERPGLLHIPRGQLPRRAREGTWLQVQIEGHQITVVRSDKQATARARRRIREKLRRLQQGQHLLNPEGDGR